jgi:PAS domain S-box-containing protein/diguanylate cyclase (GGDEF)-like protein
MRDKLTRVALRTSLWYAFFASLWIALSGLVLAAFVRDARVIAKIEISKGWIFVAVTAFLLYAVLRRQMWWLEKEAEARGQAEQLVRETQERFATIFRSSPAGISLSRLSDGRLVDANPAFLSMLGYDRHEVIGRTAREMGVFVSPRDRESFVETIRTHGRVDGVEAEVQKKSGETATMLGSSELINFAGEPHLLNIMLNITDKKRTDEALRESESRFRNAFEASAIGVALVGLDGRMLKVNRSLCESVGYSEEELLAKTFRDITHPDDLENDLEHVKRLIGDEIPYYRIEKRYVHRDGYLVWVLLSVSIVRDARGYPLYFVSQIEDTTERKILEEKLQNALITDELTGLYNRRGFFERSDEELWSAPRRGETALLFLVKLDDMKRINDTVGHKAGDALIIDVGRMLQETFRTQDVIGRIGGVEFAVLATGTEEIVNRLVALLEHVASTFERSDGRSCPVSLNVGTALSRPSEAYALEELIARANEKPSSSSSRRSTV